MQLNKRQRDIVIHLLEKSEFVTIFELSKLCNVSDRTIRNDFQIIDGYLRENKLSSIERVPNKGCRLHIGESQAEELRNMLLTVSSRNLSQRERILIASTILITKGKTTMREIAALCMVNQQTVLKDMGALSSLLAENGISLLRKTGMGLTLEGKEHKIRKYFDQIVKRDATIKLFLMDYVPLKFLDAATILIRHVESSLNLSYIDFSALHLSIAYLLLRIDESHIISDDFYKDELIPLSAAPEYSALKDLEITPPLPDKELLFIVRALMHSRVVVSDSNQTSGQYFDNVDQDVNRISDYILNELKKTLYIGNEVEGDFVKGLRMHLRVSIFRIKHNIEIQNDLLEKIKLTIPLVYEFTKKTLIECEKRFGLYFNENEIAFIAIHVAVLYEKSVNLTLPTLLIICNYGIATSKILATRMRQQLPECHIIGPLSSKEADEYLANNTPDLIASTSKYIGRIPSVTVNPLLLEKDVELINSWLIQFNYRKQCRYFVDAFSRSENDKNAIFLKDYIPKDHIMVLDHCTDWMEAIRKAAKPLLHKQYIEQRYVDKMLQSVLELGNYMVIMPEMAFLHAGVDDGINENCFSLLALREPILFGNQCPKKVRVFVVLGIKDRQNDTFLKIIKILENNLDILLSDSPHLTVDVINELKSQ